jgi:hypothetical protein
MNKATRAVLFAAVLLSGVSAAMAASWVPDRSDQYGGYHPNSTQGQRAFWDNQASRGSN